MNAFRTIRATAAAVLLAGAIQASSDSISGGSGSFVFSASPSGSGQAKTGASAMASAAAAAGFKPLQPGMPVIDMGAFRPTNKLPEGVDYVSFKTLASFVYESDYYPWNDPFTDPIRRKHPKRAIPKPILALSGRRVACMGFMLPWDFKRDGTRHFGLMRNQIGCCFGQAPGMNEWIDVTKLKPAEVLMDQPLLVVGILKVKRITEAGNTMGVYSMVAESVEPAGIEP
jgi:hypothetical protein